MAAYLTANEFKALAIISAGKVENLPPGWLEGQLLHFSQHIDDRLRKRYATPFSDPAPLIVKMWLTQLVTVRCYLKGGIDATDEQFVAVKDDARLADEQITAATNAKDGLYELPLRADLAGSGVTRGGPKVYTQNSPYAARDDHDEWAREDDAAI